MRNLRRPLSRRLSLLFWRLFLRLEPVSEDDAPELYRHARAAAERLGRSMPDFYAIPSAAANILVLPPGILAVTQGIFEILNREELGAALVCALSLGLRSREAKRAAAILPAVLCLLTALFPKGAAGKSRSRGTRSFLSAKILNKATALIGRLLRMTRPPETWLEADRLAAEACGNPLYLASALAKLDLRSGLFELHGLNPGLAPAALINPFPSGSSRRKAAPHPALEKRTAALLRAGMPEIFRGDVT